MENRDYTSPEEDREVDRYSRPNYETAEEYNKARREREQANTSYSSSYNTSYSDPQYENRRYENSQYESYANLGGQMVDGNGVPVKNYFAVQVVFAIVEICCFCCFNIGTMVLGIIALVFAIQANTAYTQRRVEEFKSKSKVSNILLIIGGIWMAVSILFNVFALTMTFNQLEGFDIELEDIMDDLEEYEYYDDYDGEYTGTDEEPLVEGFSDFVFEGVEYSVPMSFAEFEQMGFVLDDDYSGEDIDGGDYEWIYFYDENGETLGEIRVYNPEETDTLIEDCTIVYIAFNNNTIYDDEAELINLYFAGGLTMDATYEEVEAFMGVPTYTYAPDGEGGYARYSWYYYGDNGEYECFDIMFWDGVMEEVSIEVSQY